MPTRKQITRLIKKATFVTCNDISYQIASFNVAKSVPNGHVVLHLKADGHFDLRFTMPVLMKARVIDNTQLIVDDDSLVFFRQMPLEIDVSASVCAEEGAAKGLKVVSSVQSPLEVDVTKNKTDQA